MTDKEEELVSKFLEITACNSRDFSLSILKDKGWDIEAAILSFSEGDYTHEESVVSPSKFSSDFNSTIIPTGWGSEDDEVDEYQQHYNFDSVPTGLGAEDEIENDEGQEYFDLDSGLGPDDEIEDDEGQEYSDLDSGLGPEDEIEDDEGQEYSDLDSSIKSMVWVSVDENAIGEDWEHHRLDPIIRPTGWGRWDQTEVDELEEHDFEPVFDHTIMSDLDSLGDSDWQEEGSHETNLSSLYRCPIHFMHHGNFHEAKKEAARHDRWLIVNVQSTEQFDLYLLNRDAWSNDIVQKILRSHFVFWQVNHKVIEGQKVYCFYKLSSLPAILIIDPITGEKMYTCQGMKQPEDLLEDLTRFSVRSPEQHHDTSSRRKNANSLTHQIADTDEASEPTITSPLLITKPSYPSLPEEPTEKQLICKVGVCLPNGQRVQRSFLKTDSTKLLWSFCSILLEEEESKSFCFVVPSSPKLIYDDDTSFEEAGLSNTLLRLCLEGDN